jgi:uncharacterized protein YdhG (YjbR/CyaY superfamily)
MEKITYQDVDQYISTFPLATQELLQALRACILTNAPEAEECISYNMPAYKHKGILVYFAGYKKHVGFYPTGSGVQHFLPRLAHYKTSKGAIQLPLNEAIPEELIAEIVRFRVEENLKKQQAKAKKQTSKT